VWAGRTFEFKLFGPIFLAEMIWISAEVRGFGLALRRSKTIPDEAISFDHFIPDFLHASGPVLEPAIAQQKPGPETHPGCGWKTQL
jgi:hypothetical protein